MRPYNRTTLLTVYLLLATFLMAASLQAQTIRYEISFDNRVHHEAEVHITYAGLPAGKPLELRMSRSSPGRYATHEFSKNLYNIRVTSGGDKPLTYRSEAPWQWVVTPGPDGTVHFRYTLFGDRIDGTYAGIDNYQAHLNMPAVFAWARGLENTPITIRFNMPEGSGWTIATQLKPEAQPNTFCAPTLQYFLDSPTHLGAMSWREWKVKDQTIRLAVQHLGTEADVDKLAAVAKQAVLEQEAVFGELPRFDFGTYTFIACYLPWAAGDGMEHRNSTSLTSRLSIKEGLDNLVGTVSHEFFHCWNVERLRPKTLEPFDFTQANPSGELWLAEGFTSYYDQLTLTRAGEGSQKDYLEFGLGFVGGILNSPGRAFFSAADMSRRAVLWDAGVSIDAHNRNNSFTSYYPFGAFIALGLDFTLRTQFRNLTLDDYMRALWQQYGKPEKPYTLTDLENTLAALTQNKTFAANFFARYVTGREIMDYAKLCADMGLALRKANPGKAKVNHGAWGTANGKLYLSGSTLMGAPLYQAGLDVGDTLTVMDGQPVARLEDLVAIVNAHKPGDAVAVTYITRGNKTLSANVTLIEDPSWQIVLAEDAGLQPTPEAVQRRQAWLASRQKK
jgi:predicted metalloprotease with PDZ domain